MSDIDAVSITEYTIIGIILLVAILQLFAMQNWMKILCNGLAVLALILNAVILGIQMTISCGLKIFLVRAPIMVNFFAVATICSMLVQAAKRLKHLSTENELPEATAGGDILEDEIFASKKLNISRVVIWTAVAQIVAYAVEIILIALTDDPAYALVHEIPFTVTSAIIFLLIVGSARSLIHTLDENKRLVTENLKEAYHDRPAERQIRIFWLPIVEKASVRLRRELLLSVIVGFLVIILNLYNMVTTIIDVVYSDMGWCESFEDQAALKWKEFSLVLFPMFIIWHTWIPLALMYKRYRRFALNAFNCCLSEQGRRMQVTRVIASRSELRHVAIVSKNHNSHTKSFMRSFTMSRSTATAIRMRAMSKNKPSMKEIKTSPSLNNMKGLGGNNVNSNSLNVNNIMANSKSMQSFTPSHRRNTDGSNTSPRMIRKVFSTSRQSNQNTPRTNKNTPRRGSLRSPRGKLSHPGLVVDMQQVAKTPTGFERAHGAASPRSPVSPGGKHERHTTVGNAQDITEFGKSLKGLERMEPMKAQFPSVCLSPGTSSKAMGESKGDAFSTKITRTNDTKYSARNKSSNNKITGQMRGDSDNDSNESGKKSYVSENSADTDERYGHGSVLSNDGKPSFLENRMSSIDTVRAGDGNKVLSPSASTLQKVIEEGNDPQV